MRNSRLDRILYIQQVLVQGGVLNKQQTADRFGVSEKTIQRDLDTLRSYFADSEPRREILYNSAKGGYLLDDTLSRFLTSSEILAVCKILLESRSMVIIAVSKAPCKGKSFVYCLTSGSFCPYRATNLRP